MTDYIFLMSTTPSGEQCAQLGSEDYMKNSKMEARAYIGQLIRSFGENPAGSKFLLAHCPHDFGTYIDIKFFFDDEDQRHVTYMSLIENGCEKWDDAAIDELKKKGYPMEYVNESLDDSESSDDQFEDSYTNDNGPTGHGDVCMSDADPGL